MDSTGSVLYSWLKRVRFAIDEPADDAIYSNSDLIQHVFPAVLSDLWARINMQSQGLVILRHELDIVVDTEYYQLPPTVARVMRISKIYENGLPYQDLKPRSQFNSAGPGWAVEGNVISFRPTPIDSGEVSIWYIPNGSVQCHYATDGGRYATDTDNKTFTLSTSPTLGLLDKRPNGYAGQILRILGTGVHQERVIASHDVTNGRVTTRIAFDPLPATSSVTYEIAPVANESLIEAMAMRAAMKLLAFKQASGAQRQAIQMEYQHALKTVLDDLTNLNARSGLAFQKNTYDNQDVLFDWSMRSGRNIF